MHSPVDEACMKPLRYTRAMAKTRGINTKFWSDNWVSESLNPLDRYLFLYFLTNEHTNISGVYELPISAIAFETGLEKVLLQKTMLKRLQPKLYYHKGWVIIPNFPKHQNLGSVDVKKGIEREFDAAPDYIKEEAIRRGWGDGLGMARGTKLNLTKPTGAESQAIHAPSKPTEVKLNNQGEEIPTKKKEPRASDPDWPSYKKAQGVLQDHAEKPLIFTVMDFRAWKKGVQHLGEKHALDLLQEEMDSGWAAKTGYSMMKMLSANRINKYRTTWNV
jgi:hypothetical protein